MKVLGSPTDNYSELKPTLLYRRILSTTAANHVTCFKIKLYDSGERFDLSPHRKHRCRLLLFDRTRTGVLRGKIKELMMTDAPIFTGAVP